MRVSAAYLTVVLVWSTTPLAIHWSNDSFSFVAAVTLRMVLALVASYLVLVALRLPLIQKRGDWLVFCVCGLGLFPNMLLVYLAAQTLPSGLMSVLMGVFPFLVGLFSWVFFREQVFTPVKIIAVLVAFSGLAVIHLSQLQVDARAARGVVILMSACVLWSVSSVWVKKLGHSMEPIRQGTGSLLVATPFFVVCWFLMDGQLPVNVTSKSLFGVGYLVLAGSLLGHTLFFYILRNCSVVTVSLITLLAPVLALTWGVLFAGETFSSQTMLGIVMVLLSLVLYQGLVRQAGLALRTLFKRKTDKKWGTVKAEVKPSFAKLK